MGFERKRSRVIGINYWNGNLNELFENGVYDDGSNNDLDYGKGRKRYWNKVSGKWVESNKFKVFKSEIVYWYEFENLNERLIVDWFKKDDDDYYGFKFIDRVGVFISYLYKRILLDKGLKDDEEFDDYDKGIYVEKKKINRFFGSWVKEGIDILLDKGIISEKIFRESKYDNSKYLKYYLLNVKLLGKIVNRKYVEIKSIEDEIVGKEDVYKDVNWIELENIKRLEFNISDDRLEDICELKYNNKINDYKNELKWGNVFNSKKDVLRKKEFILRDKEFYKNVVRRRYGVYRDIINDLKNNIIDYSLFGYDIFSGRYYNIINSMDKEFRSELKVDGEEVVELDLKNCYISCLMYYLERLNVFRWIELNGNDFKEIYKKDILWLVDYEFNIKNKDDLNSKWKKFNKKNDYLNDSEFRSYFDKDYIIDNEYYWRNRKLFWSYQNEVDIGFYDWEDYKFGDDLTEVINKEINEDNYYSFFNEFYKVDNYLIYDWGRENNGKLFNINRVDIGDRVKNERNIRNNSNEINRDWLNFRKSDNLIYDSYNYLKDRWLREEFINNKIEVDRIDIKGKKNSYIMRGGIEVEYYDIKGSYKILKKNSEWLRKKYGSWRDYINDIGSELKIDKFEDKLLSKGIYNFRLRSLSKKDELNWEYDNLLKEKFNYDIEEYYKKYGRKFKLELDEDIIVDYSKNKVLDGEDFRFRYKELCFNKLGKNIDFYNFLKLNFSDFGRYNKRKLKSNINEFVVGNNIVDMSNNKVYNRNFYKQLLMRLMFSKKFLVDKIELKERGNLMELVFGKNLSEIIYWLKGFDFNVDFNGNKIKRKNIDDRYKNISKILGVIEVDVVEYLEKRYLEDKFYVKIFDGFMVKKSDSMKFRINMNMILKSEVGYMFELR